MDTATRDIPWQGRDFFENQEKIPPEMLEPDRGQYIAWSWDGTRIVGSDPDCETLARRLVAAGIDTERLVFDYVDEA